MKPTIAKALHHAANLTADAAILLDTLAYHIHDEEPMPAVDDTIDIDSFTSTHVRTSTNGGAWHWGSAPHINQATGEITYRLGQN